MSDIKYPYLPEGRTILYVPENHVYMAAARDFALKNSLDEHKPNASIIVKGGEIIGRGANGSHYHKLHGCERVRLKIPTGQRYDLCEGCHPKNHGEPRAIENARTNKKDPAGADLYLWGHWWCCGPCWDSMIAAGIKNVYLSANSRPGSPDPSK